MRFENGVTVKELQLERNLNKTAVDRKDSELMSLSMTLQQTVEENSILKSELRKIGGGDGNSDRVLAQSLKNLIGDFKKQSKPTRDWTKANQLISELEKIIE